MLAKQIAKLLADQIDSFVPRHFPNAKQKTGKYYLGNVRGEAGESLKIERDGPQKGSWFDHESQIGGDLIQLYRENRSISFPEAISYLKQYLGIPQGLIEPLRRIQYAEPELAKEAVAVETVPQALKYMTEERGLTLETLRRFGVGYNQRHIIFPYFREGKLVFAKHLALERTEKGKKDMFTRNYSFDKGCQHILFGHQAIEKPSRNVCITEGEIDAMTIAQFKLPDLDCASIPFGASTAKEQAIKQKWIDNEFDYLEQYEIIYLCLDNDDDGLETTRYILDRLGHDRCRLVKLPYKDANECVAREKMSREDMQACFLAARPLQHPDICTPLSLAQEVRDRIRNIYHERKGYKLPWEAHQQKIIFEPKRLTLWTGITGHGKSQLLGHILASQILWGATIFIASFEMANDVVLSRMVGQVAGRKPSDLTDREVDICLDYLDSGLFLYSPKGMADREKLLATMQYAKNKHGCDVFLIDSLLMCNISETDFDTQKLFVEKLCRFKNDNNCHVHLVTHPRKQEMSTDIPDFRSIRGSSAIPDLADMVLTVARNVGKENLRRNDPADPSRRDHWDAMIRCSKNRHGDFMDDIELWYDFHSCCYLERPYVKPQAIPNLSDMDD